MKQAKLAERLFALARGGNLSHAYILEGKRDGGKLAFAEAFAKAITPFHEDITYVKAEGLSIKDKAVESLQGRLAMKPLVGDRNVAVIEDADTMTARAQNRLLKTLEEPAGGAVIILLSENVENLLPTILSRCVLFRLEEEGFEEGELAEEAREHAKTIGAMLLQGQGFYTMSQALTLVTAGRDQAYAFLDALERWFRNLILFSIGISEGEQPEELRKWSDLLKKDKAYLAVELIEEARRDLNRNINTGYAIKNMILKMM